MKDGGLKEDQIGFIPFPTINPDIPRAEEAPTDTVHIPAGAKNKEDAKKFLAFLASPEVQTKMNEDARPAAGQQQVARSPTIRS